MKYSDETIVLTQQSVCTHLEKGNVDERRVVIDELEAIHFESVRILVIFVCSLILPLSEHQCQPNIDLAQQHNTDQVDNCGGDGDEHLEGKCRVW